MRRREPGDVSPVHHCHGGYPLPNGLAEGAMVTVKAMGVGYEDVIDPSGREWHISSCCLETPTNLWWNGEWINRFTHPDGEKAWQYWLSHEEAEREEGRWREFGL